jgi:5-formyltetrahydrofolate cyclo-ligase
LDDSRFFHLSLDLMPTTETPSPMDPRNRLRQALLAQRDAFARHPDFAAAQTALVKGLEPVLRQLEPQCLGLYWPIRGEFNAPLLRTVWDDTDEWHWALPFAQRSPLQMHYRDWRGEAPTLQDDCGIPSVAGAPVEPDVVLVPCLGYTRGGHRLGYGAGYFDRWLATRPQVTAIGVAWSFGELAPDTDGWQAQPHDQALMLVVTEHGVVSCD